MPRGPNPTEAHLLGDAALDGYFHELAPRNAAEAGATPGRGIGIYPKRSVSPAELSDRIEGEYADALFFADSSYFDHRLDERIWTALLSRHGRVAVLPEVREELGGWARRHSEHAAAAALRTGDRAMEDVDSRSWPLDHQRVLVYYINLLGLRKRIYKLAVMERESKLGRTLTDAEILSAKRDVLGSYGPRAAAIGRKGAKSEPSSATYYTDEEVTAAAFLTALYRHRSVVILTRDADLLDQFYKQQWLLDTHYRGMLLADAYLADLGGFRTVPMPEGPPWTEAFVGRSNRLLPRSSATLDELVGHKARYIRVECWLLTDTETRLSFDADLGLRRLLATKARTAGRNSEALSPRNCHIWLAPLPVSTELRGYAALAEDIRLEVPGADISMAALDVNQALLTGERFTRRFERSSR